MSLETIFVVTLVIGLLVYIVLAEQPIWLALVISGGVGIYLLKGNGVLMSSLGTLPFSATSKYSFLIIPMFVLMGVVASKARLAEDVYAVAEKFSRRLPGGLAIATILACGGFAAVTGSSVATVATIGRIAIDEMKKHGYRVAAAASIVASGGTLGVLIPPSIILVVYGILTGESIGRLLLAGIGPGLLSIAVYIVTIVVLYKRGFFTERAAGHQGQQPESPALATTSSNAIAPRRLTSSNYVGTAYIGALFFVVIGGLYSGLFTATESGAIAAALAVVVLFVRTVRTPALFLGRFREAVSETAQLSSMIFALLIGGAVFTYFLVASRLPMILVQAVTSADVSAMTVLLLVLLAMLVLGCFLDSLSILVITIPLAYPVLNSLGIDGILLGILAVKAIEIGLVTPPVGLNVYVVSAAVPGLEPSAVFKAIWPMVIADLIVIALLIVFPGIATALPDMMYG
ncbi:TRAP transporter large permease [Pollutimonas thiosulfatoxidans]|uniref:TRAP C4-dicarboxylate transport system permease DctM subunit domain-containing protein n=1 Tax=Pollutimonas thiosulfatoxidans TaxID=2028345 RepID=A0A410GE92_9BURK|nr:TRAP transporter large permease [Pollutimonas thiosulfatoxidans]QAA94626.1 hypothetical protein CKA81_12865 [Pollutimonas thiosulfatoxidans]